MDDNDSSLQDMLKFYSLGEPLAVRLRDPSSSEKATKPQEARSKLTESENGRDSSLLISESEIFMHGHGRPPNRPLQHGDMDYWMSCSMFWQQQQQYVPVAFICPLSHGIMKEPVHARDGVTYEKSAIQAWFKQGNLTSPVTKAPISHPGLLPNDRLRQAIQQWRILHTAPPGTAHR
ncbi:hypothetical protein CEUSTIGMA_g7496.t1 [Chlamydomonas eustigma]|uniref:U-box domain-containing protein n=1 Tax=Chlamydomonas eustigma TaxID=1157962 RepID=A0A250XAF5_9CHLO|nr:hypothetical protein CEUSTIGMA_g7496.t1 [Chlamydomonas eustigma]|eukprot:GAX80057.1 hypothetical protein CEUSTIGMA_g7496.t1 [Chlamydomonas eustigma]